MLFLFTSVGWEAGEPVGGDRGPGAGGRAGELVAVIEGQAAAVPVSA